MFYVKLILFTIWMVLNSFLRLLVSCLMRIGWKPGYKSLTRATAGSIEDLAVIQNKYEQSLEYLDFDKLALDGDGAKFIGMMTWLSHVSNRMYPYADKLFELFNSFIDISGSTFGTPTFLRYPIQESEANANANNFSGDMMSGVLLGLWGLRDTYSVDEKESILKVFSAIISNFFMCPHPSDTSRGRIITWWAFGHEWLQVRAFLKVACYYAEDVSKSKYLGYRMLYWLMTILAIPSRMCPDYGLFVGKVYMAWWYANHSTALFATVLEDIYSMKILRNRYPENLDILVLYRYLSRRDTDISKIISMFKEFQLPDSEVVERNIVTTSYFSLRSFESKTKSSAVLPIGSRNGKYIWERSPIDIGSDTKDSTYDYVFPYVIYIKE